LLFIFILFFLIDTIAGVNAPKSAVQTASIFRLHSMEWLVTRRAFSRAMAIFSPHASQPPKLPPLNDYISGAPIFLNRVGAVFLSLPGPHMPCMAFYPGPMRFRLSAYSIKFSKNKKWGYECI
jgi:hypothetical protein